jgi:hypothetical protein
MSLKGWDSRRWGWIIQMDDSKWLGLKQMRAFVCGAEPVEVAAQGRAEINGWVERMLAHYEYARQGKADKGLLRRHLEKMTGLRQARKTAVRFPTLPTTLGNRIAIPTFPQLRRRDLQLSNRTMRKC